MSSVLLLDGEAIFSDALCYCLSAANRTVHVGSAIRYPAVRYSRFCKKFYWWRDPSRVLERARAVAANEQIGVIMACSDIGIRLLAEHRRELETIAPVAGTPTLESLDIAFDKAAFAEFLSRTALPQPETVALRPGDGVRRFPRFPVLHCARKRQQAHSFAPCGFEFERLLANGNFGTREWVIQSYIPGQDIGCSVICRAGKILAHTIQTPIGYRELPLPRALIGSVVKKFS